MAVNWRGLVKDKTLLAAAGIGGGFGLYVYLKRKRERGAGADVATGQPISGAVGDSGAVDAYNNLQSELENLQGQITALYGGAPLPTGQQAIAPKPIPTPAPKPAPKPKPRYAMRGGHPVSYAYLKSLGYLKGTPGHYLTTGKGPYPANHPVDYAYLAYGRGAIIKRVG